MRGQRLTERLAEAPEGDCRRPGAAVDQPAGEVGGAAARMYAMRTAGSMKRGLRVAALNAGAAATWPEIRSTRLLSVAMSSPLFCPVLG